MFLEKACNKRCLKLWKARCKCATARGRKHPQQEFLQVDTTNILFICGGAFAGLDKIIDSRGKGSSIGFGAKVKSYKEQPFTEIMKSLEPEDLIKYGLIPEFIGRMPIIATLDELNESSLIKILKEPKNSLIKQYKRLFEFEDVKLEFRDDALTEIAKKAIYKKTGARGLRSILESILLKTMFSLPDMENVIKLQWMLLRLRVRQSLSLLWQKVINICSLKSISSN